MGVGRGEEVCRKGCPYIRQLANIDWATSNIKWRSNRCSKKAQPTINTDDISSPNQRTMKAIQRNVIPAGVMLLERLWVLRISSYERKRNYCEPSPQSALSH